MPEQNHDVDWEKALHVVQGDRELLVELVKTFLGECDGMFQNLTDSLAQQDRKSFKRAAHTLKGSARALHAPMDT